MTITCPFCKKELRVPPHGDREDAMRPHLKECTGLGGE